MKHLFGMLFVIGSGSVLTACGGGGGNGGSTANLPATDPNRSVVAQTAVSEAEQFGGVSALAALGKSAKVNRPNTLTLVGLAVEAQKHNSTATRATNLTYLSSLGLYYSLTSTANSAALTFFSDSAGTQPAGSISITGQSTSFPAVFHETAQLPTIPLNANLTVTISDSSLSNITVTGTESTTGIALSNINLALANFNSSPLSGTLSGSVTITDSVGTTQFSNISEQVSSNGSTISCNFSLGGFSGTVTVNADGSGSMTIRDSGGTSNATWNSSGQGTITYPDGTTANITITNSAQN